MIRTTKYSVVIFLSIILLASCKTIAVQEGENTIHLPSETQTLTTIAFGSCAREDQPQPFWNTISSFSPDLFLFMGDNIYGDSDDMHVLRKKYQKLASIKSFKNFRINTPILATWDDHDYGLNDGGREFTQKVASKVEFMRFFNIPETSSMLHHSGVYDAQIIGEKGRRVQIIMLDTRSFRDNLKPRDPEITYPEAGRYIPDDDMEKTMLGESQWKWLEEQLSKEAELRLIVSSVQLIPEEHGWEKWGNLPHERTRFFQLIEDTKANGVLLLSGDRHLAEISKIETLGDHPLPYPIYEVTSSGLNNGGGGQASEINSHRVGENFRANNFGIITLNWNGQNTEILMQVFDDKRNLGLEQRILLSDISGQ